MLNNFCSHVCAQKSLVLAEIAMCFFLTPASSSRELGVHGAGSQLKIKPNPNLLRGRQNWIDH